MKRLGVGMGYYETYYYYFYTVIHKYDQCTYDNQHLLVHSYTINAQTHL